jgi:CheY-like chemotaxis protein
VPTRQIRVGIVDDDELVSNVLRVMLKDAGCVVTAVASTYDDAITLLEIPDACEAVFIDLYLGGYATGAAVARHAVQRGLPVVVVTGSQVLPADLSGTALLFKPFSSEQVRLLVHELRQMVLKRDVAPTVSA